MVSDDQRILAAHRLASNRMSIPCNSVGPSPPSPCAVASSGDPREGPGLGSTGQLRDAAQCLDLVPTQAEGNPRTRRDALRNNALLLDVARRLVNEVGAENVTMDAVAVQAGLGKGTVFRTFGSKAGLFASLLDEDESAIQRAYLFGPPPLGPGAPPVPRLLAYGRARLKFVQRNMGLLLSASAGYGIREAGAARVERVHVLELLMQAGVTGNRAVQADALIGLLDAKYISRQQRNGRRLSAITRAWCDLARKLCAT